MMRPTQTRDTPGRHHRLHLHPKSAGRLVFDGHHPRPPRPRLAALPEDRGRGTLRERWDHGPRGQGPRLHRRRPLGAPRPRTGRLRGPQVVPMGVALGHRPPGSGRPRVGHAQARGLPRHDADTRRRHDRGRGEKPLGLSLLRIGDAAQAETRPPLRGGAAGPAHGEERRVSPVARNSNWQRELVSPRSNLLPRRSRGCPSRGPGPPDDSGRVPAARFRLPRAAGAAL